MQDEIELMLAAMKVNLTLNLIYQST